MGRANRGRFAFSWIVIVAMALVACELEQGEDVDVPTGKVTVGTLRKTRTGEDPVARTENPPIHLVYQGTLPQREVRWIQIVLRAQPQLVQHVTRANFDGVMTKGEADHALPGDPNLGKRQLRMGAHDPFWGPEPRPQFDDAPSTGYTLFETYIILCQIHYQDNPKQWKATILKVFHWYYERDKNPILNTVDPDKSGSYKHSLNEAIADFSPAGQKSFEFDVWYPCPAGGGPPASGTDPCKQP